jgi:hypothetical protein
MTCYSLSCAKPVLEALNIHLQGNRRQIISSRAKIGYLSIIRQIVEALDEAAEKVGLQETRMGEVRQLKRITPHLLRELQPLNTIYKDRY